MTIAKLETIRFVTKMLAIVQANGEGPTSALMVCPTMRIIQGNHSQWRLVTMIESRVFENLIDDMHY